MFAKKGFRNISRYFLCIDFLITGAKNIVRHTEDLVM